MIEPYIHAPSIAGGVVVSNVGRIRRISDIDDQEIVVIGDICVVTQDRHVSRGRWRVRVLSEVIQSDKRRVSGRNRQVEDLNTYPIIVA